MNIILGKLLETKGKYRKLENEINKSHFTDKKTKA